MDVATRPLWKLVLGLGELQKVEKVLKPFLEVNHIDVILNEDQPQ